MIDATPTAISATIAGLHAAPQDAARVRAPLHVGRGDGDAARELGGVVRAGRPVPSARAEATTPNGAIRLRVRNQTLNVSPCARHSSRPNWAMSARVSTV